MIKYALISIITVISIVGCGGGGGGSEEPTTSAPVAPAGFQYKTTQDLSLEIEVAYDEPHDFNTSAQRQIIIYHNTSQDIVLDPGEVLDDETLLSDEVLMDSVITSNPIQLSLPSLGNHIDEIKISIPSLYYECVFEVPDLTLVKPDCDKVDYNRTITVTESFN